ncbi:hypothetical protein QUF80_02565 [Desulfococcaceae bacterium HSG8]|nr:hypothetical protein [Desulfococcaceae bacterium HSG8]
MTKIKFRIIIRIAILHSLFFLICACDNDKSGSAEIIKTAIMAANKGDFKTADSCLSKLDKPGIRKAVSGQRKIHSAYIDWYKITGNTSIKRLDIKEIPAIKMTKGVIYKVTIYYEKGTGKLKLTTIKENGEWKITFLKIDLIHNYIDSFGDGNNDIRKDIKLIRTAIMAANAGDFKTFESYLSKIDKSAVEISFPNRKPVLRSCYDWDKLTENRTINKTDIRKTDVSHLTDGNIYEITMFYDKGVGKTGLTTIKENGEWKITFLKMHLIDKYITWP